MASPKPLEIAKKALGKRIRDLRASSQWSQEKLAAEAGMHRTYIWGIEQGVRNPCLRHLIKIADALSVRLSTLFDGV